MRTALVTLWRRPTLARPVVWTLVVVTVIDLANALVGGLRTGMLGVATDVTWLILTFYVPLSWVTTGLMAWVLHTRWAVIGAHDPPRVAS